MRVSTFNSSVSIISFCPFSGVEPIFRRYDHHLEIFIRTHPQITKAPEEFYYNDASIEPQESEVSRISITAAEATEWFCLTLYYQPAHLAAFLLWE